MRRCLLVAVVAQPFGHRGPPLRRPGRIRAARMHLSDASQPAGLAAEAVLAGARTAQHGDERHQDMRDRGAARQDRGADVPDQCQVCRGWGCEICCGCERCGGYLNEHHVIAGRSMCRCPALGVHETPGGSDAGGGERGAERGRDASDSSQCQDCQGWGCEACCGCERCGGWLDEQHVIAGGSMCLCPALGAHEMPGGFSARRLRRAARHCRRRPARPLGAGSVAGHAAASTARSSTAASTARGARRVSRRGASLK